MTTAQAQANASGHPRTSTADPVFHVTHWKAGSKWVQAVLRQMAPDRFVPLKPDMSHVMRDPIREGGIYSPVYLTRQVFTGAVTVPHRRFVVIRDLRDTLVSWYFSLKVSHGTATNAVVAEFRAKLGAMSVEDGLVFLIEDRLAHIASVHSTWLVPGEFVLRYEDLLADEQAGFARICEHCALAIPEATRHRVVAANSFERVSGRKRGQENATHHFRKGVAGDWANHFTDRVKDLFKERFGRLLVDTGYETDLSW